MLVDHLFQCRISPWPKTAEKRGFCTCVTDIRTNGPTDGPTDRRTDGPTDRPSYRDAFLTDASKKRGTIYHQSSSSNLRPLFHSFFHYLRNKKQLSINVNVARFQVKFLVMYGWFKELFSPLWPWPAGIFKHDHRFSCDRCVATRAVFGRSSSSVQPWAAVTAVNASQKIYY